MSFFYPTKVNIALAGLGVNPNTFGGAWRSEMQQLCKQAGLTPQEAAVVIMGEGLGINIPDTAEIVMATFHRDGQLDYTKPPVIEAMRKMRFRI